MRSSAVIARCRRSSRVLRAREIERTSPIDYAASSAPCPCQRRSLGRPLARSSTFLRRPLLFFSRPFFPPLGRPSRSSVVLSLPASLAFLRVVRAYEFDFTRFPSIVERRKLFLQPNDLRPALLLFLLPILLREAPRIVHPFPLFVSPSSSRNPGRSLSPSSL